ncbi:MAG: outer membrane beta-barrel domain-containing protein [Bdellovibrionales bacterium]|nr:outer membrane beta-barrel domain-containing protein [Bdellovibrionales bacterium]
MKTPFFRFWRPYVFLSFIVFSSLAQTAEANTVEFPEEELATESVYPLFDQPTAYKSKNVKRRGHFELGLFAGTFLNDPFFSPIAFGGHLGFHFAEEHGVQLFASLLTRTTSQYVEPLKTPLNAPLGGPDFNLAPSPSRIIAALYEWTPYYGKISLTKEGVMNLDLNFNAGLGMIAIQDENRLALALGANQNFYFTKALGLKLDFKSFMYRGPDPVSRNLNPKNGGPQAMPPNSFFDDKTHLNFVISAGVVYIL